MPDTDAEETARQCRDIITRDALSAGTHFLQTTLQSRLDSLYGSGQLSDAQKKGYLPKRPSPFRMRAALLSGAFKKSPCPLRHGTL